MTTLSLIENLTGLIIAIALFGFLIHTLIRPDRY